MTLAITVIILLAILALLLYKMSTTDQTARVQITLATATDVVSFPYKFLESDDLVVTSGGRGTLVLDTDYSVTGAGDSSGGDVTMIGGTVAERITVTRSTDNSQETTIATNGPLSSSGLEAALDKLTKITQDQSEEISRALTLPHSEVNGFSATIADATTRANKVLSFDGTGALNVTDDAPDSAIAAAASAVESAASAALALIAAQNDGVVSIAALKAIDASALPDNYALQLLGYYAEGDGGGGTFYWDAASTTDENGDTVIAPTAGGTGRWMRISNNLEEFASRNNIAKNRQPVSFPSWFTWTPQFSVFRSPNGTHYTDFEIKDEDDIEGLTYYLSPLGDDLNDGLTIDSPKLSIGTLISDINATAATGARFILKSGEYLASNSANWDGVSPEFDLSITCKVGRAVIAAARPASAETWTVNGSFPNCYLTNNGIVEASAYDKTNLDENGRPISLIIVDSAAECDALPNSIYTSGGTVFMRTFDDREPDANIITCDNTPAAISNNDGVKLYAENIDFFGGNVAFDVSPTNDNEAYFNKCAFLYAGAFGLRSYQGASSKCFSVDCLAAHCGNDGFNYHTSGRFFEERCVAYNLGNYSIAADGTYNGTTAHNSTKGVRVSGQYSSYNRALHDVNESVETLNYSLTATGVIWDVNEDDNASNFAVGLFGPEQNSTKCLFANCKSIGLSPFDLAVFNTGAIVEVEDCDFTAVSIEEPISVISGNQGYGSEFIQLRAVDLTTIANYELFTPSNDRKLIVTGDAIITPTTYTVGAHTTDAVIRVDNGTDGQDVISSTTLTAPVVSTGIRCLLDSAVNIIDASNPLRLRITTADDADSFIADIWIPVKRLR